MELSLNVWQRVMLGRIIGAVHGDAQTVHKAVHLLDVLELSPKEKEEIGYQELPDGSARWEKTDARFKMEIDGNLGAFLVQKAKEFQGWTVNKDVVELFGKLGITEE